MTVTGLQVMSLEKWLADGKRSDVTWSDRHLKQMTSLLSSDDQMVEAFVSFSRSFMTIFQKRYFLIMVINLETEFMSNKMASNLNQLLFNFMAESFNMTHTI